MSGYAKHFLPRSVFYGAAAIAIVIRLAFLAANMYRDFDLYELNKEDDASAAPKTTRKFAPARFRPTVRRASARAFSGLS